MSHTILIVDDSPIIRTVMKKSILMSGLDIGSIHFAGNGEEALKVLNEQWIDIVFADINMPIMSGLELVDKMGLDPMLSSVPVVIVSSMNDQLQIESLKKAGVKAYIHKPVTPEVLRDVAMQILGEL